MTAQARPLRPADLPALVLHDPQRQANQAVTLDRCDAHAALPCGWAGLLRAALVPRSGRRVWICRRGTRLAGLAALRRRGDAAAWEIETLLWDGSDAYLLDLLDRGVATAGADGAGRLFLRLPAQSPALEPSLRHGFVAVTRETRFVGPSPAIAAATEGTQRTPAEETNGAQRHACPERSRRAPQDTTRGAQPHAPQDTARGAQPHAPQDTEGVLPRDRAHDPALFTLFCAGVPQEVRWHTALSPAEWRAAQEPLDGGREWLLPTVRDGLSALIRLAGGRGAVRASILTTGEPATEERALRAAFGLARRGGQFHLLVPEYAVSQARIAAEAGLEPVEELVVLVRPIAQRVRRLQLAEHAVNGSVRPVIQ